MPRPSSPLISRGATVAAALRIIDEGGRESLSLPRLATELDVKAPSLYHHFADKNAILAAVAESLVRASVLPRKPPQPDWIEWFTQLALNFRTAVLRHRRAAPLLLEFLPHDFMTDLYEGAAAYLVECGVPVTAHLLILDGLEKFTIGATLAEAMGPATRGRVRFSRVRADRHPVLAAASEANELTAREIFETAIRSYLSGLQVEGGVGADARR